MPTYDVSFRVTSEKEWGGNELVKWLYEGANSYDIWVPNDAVVTVVPDPVPAEPGFYYSCDSDSDYMLTPGKTWYLYFSLGNDWIACNPKTLPADLVRVDI